LALSENLKGSYEVAAGRRAVYVRVHGLASMTNCLCVRDVLDRFIRSKRTFVVFDLGDCTGMDSTFMGVIAGVATQDLNDKPVGVAIVNAPPRIVKLLESVGLTELVYVDPDPFETPEVQFHLLEEQATEEERLQLIRTAHEHLIAISEENEKIFGPLLRAVEREMKQRGMI